jgi:glycosyltransferase involved in cell wall biosynthesis
MTAALQQIVEPKPEVVRARVALLTVLVSPYRHPLFKCLQSRVMELLILCSASADEACRPWTTSYADLPSFVQRGFRLRWKRRHPHGFSIPYYVYLPLDTLPRLFHFRPDVVISGEMGFRTLQALAYRKLCPRSRLIVWATLSEVSEMTHGKLRNWIRSWLLPQVDAVLVNGSSGASHISRFGVRPDRIVRVPYTCDLTPFLGIRREQPRDNKLRLLYVGQLNEGKGLVPFLRQLAAWSGKFRSPEIDVQLVGDGPLRQTIESFSARYRLRLQIVGNVPYTDLPKYYANADVFFFPSLSDEWGLVINEALGSGLPVLGSLHSQAVETLIKQGKNGWTFRADQDCEMYSAIERALSTPADDWKNLQAAARESIVSLTPEFSAEAMLAAVQMVL